MPALPHPTMELPRQMPTSDRPTEGRGDAPRQAAAAGAHAHGPADAAFRHSYSKDKAQLIRRLSRIEGQVRGIARMIEREEYCVDILQQTSALRAAVDSLAILVLAGHPPGGGRTAAARGGA